MAPSPRLRVLSVGSNAISAFVSWRLQATTSCDVTLVWKSNFEAVSKYGVSFKSKTFGNERFKPRHVVRAPEEASSRENAYDYVILCVKALPDVYDLAAVIESVVTPQHTCIVVNTTNTIGVESHLEQRFPTNTVLSLVSGLEISQMGPSEFEHLDSSEVWVGAASKAPNSVASSLQNDMASALAMTLTSGQVDCKVSDNIRQEQFERMIGPIAFQPASVLFESSNHAQLLEKVGVRQLISDVIDELLILARAHGCKFPGDFRQKTIDKMAAIEIPSTMYQDFQMRRPMEVETYLGSPIKLATESDVRVPRIETLYAMLHHVNAANLSKPQTKNSPPPVAAPAGPPPRMSSVPPPQRGPPNGSMRPGPTRNPSGMMMPPPRRPMMRPPPPGVQPPSAGRLPRETSLEGLEEFSHLVVYDDADGVSPPQPQPQAHQESDMPPSGAPPASAAELSLRERELALRQRELQMQEREMNMRRGGGGGGGRRRGPSRASAFDEEDEDDYFDPMETPLPVPTIDPDSVDMMSLTSRRSRKPTPSQVRKNPEIQVNNSRPGSSFSRYFGGGRKRASERIMQEIPGLHDSLMDHPMMSYSSNRYGAVDRNQMQADSRANSMTASRMGDFAPHPYPMSRRNSHSPAYGNAGPGPGPRTNRPMTGQDPHSHVPPNGPPYGGNPPPNMRAPVPKHPPGHGNAVAPQQIEQHYGVSNPVPAKDAPKNRSLTGSASASAKSGESGASANIESENSAFSSQASLGAQQNMTPAR